MTGVNSYFYGKTIHQCPGWKKLPPLSERLTSSCLIGAQLRSPLKPLDNIVLWYSRGFRGLSIRLPWCPERRSLYFFLSFFTLYFFVLRQFRNLSEINPTCYQKVRERLLFMERRIIVRILLHEKINLNNQPQRFPRSWQP